MRVLADEITYAPMQKLSLRINPIPYCRNIYTKKETPPGPNFDIIFGAEKCIALSLRMQDTSKYDLCTKCKNN